MSKSSFSTYASLGGAGTWSDGKLVTRIGKNSATVLAVSILRLPNVKLKHFMFEYKRKNCDHCVNCLQVLKTLVRFGAPDNILVNGKPHLGTDKLVPLLRNFRHYLQSAGVSLE